MTTGYFIASLFFRLPDISSREASYMIDDIYGNQNEDVWVALDAHPKIEVRLWNPWKRAPGRLIQSVVRVNQINYRMHAKSFTADNQATILGGRNIGDQYFAADTQVAFADLDVLSVGPPVREVSSAFDAYWNAEHAFPVNILVRRGTEKDVDDLRSAKEAFFDKKSTSDYVQTWSSRRSPTPPRCRS